MKRANPFLRAVEFGRCAYRDGLPVSANPYDDKRKQDGWSRAWVKAWKDGYEEEAKKSASKEATED